MQRNRSDISLIITAHNEGLLLGATINSALAAAKEAQSQGFVTETTIYLDRADRPTSEFARTLAKDLDIPVIETDFGDQGKVRNLACQTASTGYIAFLDGDDLWSENWISLAMQIALKNKMYIVHPEMNWFFGGSNNILLKVDQESESFDPSFLRAGNPWDALCLAHRDTYLATPYCNRDIATGFAYEDWHWNCETVAKGYVHKVAKGTIHFKRRREISQNTQATSRKVLIRDTPLLLYPEK
ncbi:glycosyltransferase family A protein [Microbulbifer hainanensis]|uniref:glycosyltransferase family A protein n=1 Tax=Microbulbifer hainanensis TaxID=2735675 RepID=UPI0018682FDC|nr:glycosyltransferase family A protein [Microbulbifer hainanensis]